MENEKLLNSTDNSAIKVETQQEIKLSRAQELKYARKFRKSTLMDDMKFRMVCESKEAIQEILRVVLNDDKLVVVESIKQKTEDVPIFHGVILDCRCRLKTREYVDVEVQVASDDDAVRRMRYNCSMVTIENSPKRKRFKYKYIPNVILVMFCQFDLFKKNKAIYEIDRIVRGTGIVSNNGVREIYVNTTAKTTDKKLEALFKIMTTIREVDDVVFPKLSQKKLEVNDLYVGGRNMAGLDLMMYKDGVKDGKMAGREEGIQEGKISSIINLFKKKIIDIKVAADELGMTKEEFALLLK